jgi:hypothetical protein
MVIYGGIKTLIASWTQNFSISFWLMQGVLTFGYSHAGNVYMCFSEHGLPGLLKDALL